MTEQFTTPMEEEFQQALASEQDGEVKAAFSGGLDDYLSAIVGNVYRLGDRANLILTANDAAGGLAIWQNTTGHPVLVDGGRLYVKTASTGACTVSVGLNAAANPLVPAVATNMFSGQSVAATGVFVSATAFIVPKDAYVVASVASGASAGLVGNLLFTAVVVAA